MNIFFTGSVRGGRAKQPQYARIVEALSSYGTVSSGYVSDETLSGHGETQLSGTEILEREIAALEQSDIVVAEVTAPSLGVGYLIASATTRGKRVLALHEGEDTEKLSGIVKGDALVEVCAYTTDEDLKRIFAEQFPA